MIRSAISPRFAISTRVMLMRGRRPCARPVEANAGRRDSGEQAREQPNRHADSVQRDGKEGEADGEGEPLTEEHRPRPGRVVSPHAVHGELGERAQEVAEIGEDAVDDGAAKQEAERRPAAAQRGRQRLEERRDDDGRAARGTDDQVVGAPALLPPLEDGARGPAGRRQGVEELNQVGQRALRRWSRPIWGPERWLSSTLLRKVRRAPHHPSALFPPSAFPSFRLSVFPPPYNGIVLRCISAAGSFAAPICSLKRISTAPRGPITAISADGHAKLTSPRMCRELITSYAPPYALRVITVSLGTVASQYA